MTDKGIRVAAVCGPLTALSAEKLKEADPAYPGAELILANAPKVYSTCAQAVIIECTH